VSDGQCARGAVCGEQRSRPRAAESVLQERNSCRDCRHLQKSQSRRVSHQRKPIILLIIIITIIIIISMILLFNSFESWGAGSPLGSKRSDSLHTCSRGCQSLCSDSIASFCMTAFHQARTSGHQWNSFYYFHLAFNPRDLYYRGYKKIIITNDNL